MATFDARADLKKNRLYITLAGEFSQAEAQAAADLVIKESNKLSPGFDAINDAVDMVSNLAVGAEISRAQIYIKQRGVRRVVRVVKYYSVGQQFAVQSQHAGYMGLQALTVASAEAMLDTMATLEENRAALAKTKAGER